jgi:hypothetical protein
VQYSTSDAARATRRRGESNGSTYWITTFLGVNRHTLASGAGPADADDLYPMAFLIEQDAGKVVLPHFHQADQFQVFIQGDGKLGPQIAGPLMVQFAARFSAYGPIVAGQHGIHYFTLRNGWDPGARYMPGARGELHARRRQPHRVAVSALMAAPGTNKGEAVVEVLPPAPDGLGAWRFHVPPQGKCNGPDPAAGRGQMWLVLSGKAGLPDGSELSKYSCVFVNPDDIAMTLRTGLHGADILCMQYPKL